MNIDVTLITVFFGAFGLVYLAGLIRMLLRPARVGKAEANTFSLIVPASNEESVIAQTVHSLFALDYPAERFEIVVVDDGSTDRTGEILDGLRPRYGERLQVIHVPTEEARRGKSAALNRAFGHLRANSRFRGRADWVVGIFDADCLADRPLLRRASFHFLRPEVGGVQSAVRIYNRHRSTLARIQDVEFTGFTRAMQMIRVVLFKSAGFGGNGQFIRAEALIRAAPPGEPAMYWKEDSLTEDLELNTRVILQNWDFEFVADAGVEQEGVERIRDLYRQRTRWAWGYLQVFTDYVLRGRLFTHKGTRLGKRLDMLLHLLIFLSSPLVFLTWMLTLFAAVGLIALVNYVPPMATLFLTAGFLPIVLYGMLPYRDYRGLRKLRDAFLFGVFAFHWVPCYLRAIVHMVRRDRPRWLKTPRIAPPV